MRFASSCVFYCYLQNELILKNRPYLFRNRDAIYKSNSEFMNVFKPFCKTIIALHDLSHYDNKHDITSSKCVEGRDSDSLDPHNLISLVS